MTSAHSQFTITAFTLAVGAVGAVLGYALSLPIFILTGPAILITLLSLTGIRFAIANPLRDAALLLIGINIGAGVNSQTAQAFLRWPIAFLLLAAMLVGILYTSRQLLQRGFGYDANSAILCSTPGHLSFVMTMGATLNLNVAQIAVVQAVRLFSLTMLVPFAALAFGVELNAFPKLSEPALTALHLAALLAIGLGLGLIFKRFNAPAPLLMGGLLISTLSHLTGITPGPMHPWVALPGFLVLGSLIGARFSGISLSLLKSSLLAGLAVTAVGAAWSLCAAYLVAQFLDMPLIHVLVAFAPGGLETMIALGAVIGANPGFVAAIHVARLLMLIVLVPLMMPKQGVSSP